MKKTPYVFIVIALYAISSCNDKDALDVDKIRVDMSDADRFASAAMLVDTSACRIFQLDESSIPVASLNKVRISDGRILIYDEYSYVINEFTTEGKYVGTLDKRGKAADEYLEITDFCPTSTGLYVLDQSNQHVKVYDRNYEFVRNIGISDYWGNGMFVCNDNIWLVNNTSKTSSGRYHLFALDRDGRCIGRYLQFSSDCALVSDDSYSICKDNVVYFRKDNNTVYTIDSHGVAPSFTIDFGDCTLPQEYQDMDARQLVRNDVDGKYVVGIEKIYNMPQCYLMTFRYQQNSYWLLSWKDRENDDLVCRGFLGCPPYKLGLVNIACDGNCLYSFFPSDTYQSLYENILEDDMSIDAERKRELEQIYDKTMENDNPVVVRYKLRVSSDVE